MTRWTMIACVAALASFAEPAAHAQEPSAGSGEAQKPAGAARKTASPKDGAQKGAQGEVRGSAQPEAQKGAQGEVRGSAQPEAQKGAQGAVKGSAQPEAQKGAQGEVKGAKPTDAEQRALREAKPLTEAEAQKRAEDTLKAATQPRDGAATDPSGSAEEDESDLPLTPEEQRAMEAEERRLRALAREYETLSGDPNREERDTAAAATETSQRAEKSLFTAFIQMVLVLGAVCLLAYLLLGKLLPRLMRIEPPVAQRRILQVIDRLPLDQRRAILVLRIGDSYYLVGASEQGIALLSRLDSDDVTRALATAELPRPQLGKLAGVFLRRNEKS